MYNMWGSNSEHFMCVREMRMWMRLNDGKLSDVVEKYFSCII